MTAKLDRSWAHEMRGAQAGTKAGLQRRLHALLIKAAIAERAEREAVGEEGDVEEEESEQGLSSSLSEGVGEGQARRVKRAQAHMKRYNVGRSAGDLGCQIQVKMRGPISPND